MLSPIESILLNKLMPKGFKFETEENIVKPMETSKNQSKKNKSSTKCDDGSKRLKSKKNYNDSYKENDYNSNNNNNKLTKLDKN